MENKPNLTGILVGVLLAFVGSVLPQIWGVYERHREVRRAIFDLRAEIGMNGKILQRGREQVRGGVLSPFVTKGYRIGTELSSAAFERNWTHLAGEDDALSRAIMDYYVTLKQVTEEEAMLIGAKELADAGLADAETQIQRREEHREFLIANGEHLKDLPVLLKHNEDEIKEFARTEEGIRREVPELQKKTTETFLSAIDMALVSGDAAISAFDLMTKILKRSDFFLSWWIGVALLLVLDIYLRLFSSKKSSYRSS